MLTPHNVHGCFFLMKKKPALNFCTCIIYENNSCFHSSTAWDLFPNHQTSDWNKHWWADGQSSVCSLALLAFHQQLQICNVSDSLWQLFLSNIFIWLNEFFFIDLHEKKSVGETHFYMNGFARDSFWPRGKKQLGNDLFTSSLQPLRDRDKFRDKFRQLPESSVTKHVHDLLLLIMGAEENYVEAPILRYKIANFT